MGRLITVSGVKVMVDPAPNLLPDMRTRIELTMRNGMVTMPSDVVESVIESMAAVLVARGDDERIESIQEKLSALIEGQEASE